MIEQIKQTDCAEALAKCDCGKEHKFFVKFKNDPNLDKEEKEKGFKPYPSDGIIRCDCGKIIDVCGFRVDIENKSGKKIIL